MLLCDFVAFSKPKGFENIRATARLLCEYSSDFLMEK